MGNLKAMGFWDKLNLGMTVAYTVVLMGWLHFDHAHFNPDYMGGLVVGTFLVPLFRYRSLRQKEVFWAWVMLAALLFGLSFWLRQDRQLIMPGSGKSAALGLKGLLGILISYRIFSWIARTTFSTELIVPSKYASYDSKEGRYPNNADFFAFVSYVIIMLISTQF